MGEKMPSKAEVLAEIVETLPAMAGVEEALSLLLTIKMLYLGKEDAGVALNQIELLFEVGPEGINNACRQVLYALADEWEKARSRFNQRRESEDDPVLNEVDFDAFETRYLLEKDQQDKRSALGQAVISLVQEVCRELKIELPLPEAEPAQTEKKEVESETVKVTVEEEKPAKKPSKMMKLLRRIGQSRLLPFSMVVPPEETATATVGTTAAENAPSEPEPNSPWTSPAVIDVNNRDYRILTEIVAPILGGENPEEMINALADRNLDRDRLTAILIRYRDLGNEEVAQAASALDAITRDDVQDSERVEEIQSLQDLTNDVLDYFEMEIQMGNEPVEEDLL